MKPATSAPKLRINIGCGRAPTEGWLNFDNSFSLKLSKYPVIISILRRLGWLGKAQIENLSFQRDAAVAYCDARKHIPIPDGSAEVVYSSHMVEHLDPEECIVHLQEVKRCLCAGGIVRLALPNLRWHVSNYINSGDADEFVKRTYLGRHLPKGIRSKLTALILGEREYHVWMYDERSAKGLLERNGFEDVTILESGRTNIEHSDPLNLSERSPESLFVEGRNPSAIGKLRHDAKMHEAVERADS